MSKPPKAWPKKKSKKQTDPLLCFDILWLCGQKTAPDPLPSRQEYLLEKNNGPTPKKNSWMSVNILASLLALGSCCAVGYSVYKSGWLAPESNSQPIATDNNQWTTEEQRQANETIEAILALQEMAASSESNPPTQKR